MRHFSPRVEHYVSQSPGRMIGVSVDPQRNGVPHGAADPRAAHPARRRRRISARRRRCSRRWRRCTASITARPGCRDCRPHSWPRARTGPPACGPGVRAAERRLLRHDRAGRAGGLRDRIRETALAAGNNFRFTRRASTRSGSPSTRCIARRSGRCCRHLRPRARGRRSPRLPASPPARLRGRRRFAGLPGSLRTRCSTAITRKRRRRVS